MMKEYFMSTTAAYRRGYEVEATLYYQLTSTLEECTRQIPLRPSLQPSLVQHNKEDQQ